MCAATLFSPGKTRSMRSKLIWRSPSGSTPPNLGTYGDVNARSSAATAASESSVKDGGDATLDLLAKQYVSAAARAHDSALPQAGEIGCRQQKVAIRTVGRKSQHESNLPAFLFGQGLEFRGVLQIGKAVFQPGRLSCDPKCLHLFLGGLHRTDSIPYGGNIEIRRENSSKPAY